MKPSLLLKIAALLQGTFAIGHSMGHFTRYEVEDPKAKEVLKVMIENKFDMMGVFRSYDDYWTGMSLNLIITILTIIMLLWHTSRFCESQPRTAIGILVPLAACTGIFAVTSWIYFFMIPAIVCFMTFVLIMISIARLAKVN